MSRAFGIAIDIEGPVLTAGLETPAYGIDTGFARDLDGGFVLPGTLVKGVVRHMLLAFGNAAPDKLPDATLTRWFGDASGAVYENDPPDRFEPVRARVRFGDFKLTKVSPDPLGRGPAHLTRIAVDGELGSVRHGMLQVLESPVGYGGCATFSGIVTIDAGDSEAEQAAGWILKALRLVPAVGSAKGAGFGHILAVRQVAAAPPAARPGIATNPAALAGDRLGYVLAFDEPLLVGSQTISGNLFKSSEEMAGGVLKGALARRIEALGRMPELGEALDRMIIRHARPAPYSNGKAPIPARPHTIPLSVYSLKRFERNGDLAEPELFDAANPANEPAEEAAVYPAIVAFAGDWKDAERTKAKQLFGLTADLRHDVRTRTAIEGGLAATSQLFSRIALNPAGHVWIGEIERGEADEAAFRDILELMDSELPGIGKTGATARVAFATAEKRTSPQPLRGGAPAGKPEWRIVLETDALLHGPGDVSKFDDLPPEERLNAQYREYFADAMRQRGGPADISAGDLELRFFAKQRWVGGYLARRFPVYPDRYYPHLVSEAGSVFILAAPPAAAAAIASFARLGLPLPGSVPEQDFQYKRSPFPPQNGYGEVSIAPDYFSEENPLGA